MKSNEEKCGLLLASLNVGRKGKEMTNEQFEERAAIME